MQSIDLLLNISDLFFKHDVESKKEKDTLLSFDLVNTLNKKVFHPESWTQVLFLV